MDAIVLAGGIPRSDHPLFELTLGRPKAMLPIGGKPMIAHVLTALRQTERVEELVVVGLNNPADHEALSEFSVAAFLPDQGGLVANGMSGLRWLAEHRPQTRTVIGCSSDIPHIESEMIDHLIDLCRPFDRLFYYPVVTRTLLEQKYPQSRRTYAGFKGGLEVAGADIFVLQTAFLETDHSLWEKLVAARKNPFQIARVVGWAPLLKLIWRRLSLEDAAALAGRILGSDHPIGIVFPPFAELAMDADKPHQVEILRKMMGGG